MNECKHKWKIIRSKGRVMKFECSVCGEKIGSENKYKNKLTEIDGITFDSRKEGMYYLTLKEAKKRGEIKEFKLQEVFVLQPSHRTVHKEALRPITYHADFCVYHHDGRVEIIDVKGMETEVFRIKWKLLKYKFRDEASVTFKII